MTGTACTKCQQPARLTDGREIYPHRKDLYEKSFYKCDGCGGYVGCHPGSTDPLGTPADKPLRAARSATHALLDPIWRDAVQEYQGPFAPGQKKRITRRARCRVYAYLADRMGLTEEQCHVGMFDHAQCEQARMILLGTPYQVIRKWAYQQEVPAPLETTTEGD